MSAYALQPWHITIGDELVLEEGSGRLDLARGYYDPNTQEVVITLQGWDADDPRIGPFVQRIVARFIYGQWPTADVVVSPAPS
jgi:hypothetical protein